MTNKVVEVTFAACSSHAPHILSRRIQSSEEYRKQVERVHRTLEELGKELRKKNVDTLIVIGGDHYETFFFDNFPMLNVYVDNRAFARVQNEELPYEIDVEMAKELLFGLAKEDFDISFSQGPFRLSHAVVSPTYWMFKSHRVPIVPIHMNTNIEPMISPQRAFRFGETLTRVLQRIPLKKNIGILGTGGLSHFPGTPYYGKVDVEFDKRFLSLLEEGRTDEIYKLSVEELEESGNIELRAWMSIVGAVKRRARTLLFEPTYHIDYAIVNFEL